MQSKPKSKKQKTIKPSKVHDSGISYCGISGSGISGCGISMTLAIALVGYLLPFRKDLKELFYID